MYESIQGHRRGRHLIAMLLCAFVVVGCGGASEEELAEIAAPLVDAHDDLEDFTFKIGSGMSRGDFIDEWPEVASQIARGLRDYQNGRPDDLPETDAGELAEYTLAIAETVDHWTEAAQATREFLFEDGAESTIRVAMNRADERFGELEALRNAALSPGEG